MSAVSYALTTEQKVKDRLAITVSDLDTVIKRMMYSATVFIQQMAGVTSFKSQTYTDEKYNGAPINSDKRDNMIILRNVNVTSITNVKYNNGTQANPSWVTMSADEYTLDYETGILHFSSYLPAGIANITVTYVAGYLIDFANEFDSALHTLPYELNDLCERLVTKLLKKRESEGRSQESFNNSSITWGKFLEEHDEAIITNYRRAFLA